MITIKDDYGKDYEILDVQAFKNHIEKYQVLAGKLSYLLTKSAKWSGKELTKDAKFAFESLKEKLRELNLESFLLKKTKLENNLTKILK